MGNKVLNLTPHAITVFVNGKKIEIPPSGYVLRFSTREVSKPPLELDGTEIPVVSQKFEELEILKDGKPLSKEEARELLHDAQAIIVPSIVGKYAVYLIWELCPENVSLRVLAPNTSKAIRDKEGRIIGVSSFVDFSS